MHPAKIEGTGANSVSLYVCLLPTFTIPVYGPEESILLEGPIEKESKTKLHSCFSDEDKNGSDKKILISNIGLRPGEKMHEELSHDGKLESTTHPRVYRASTDKIEKKHDLRSAGNTREYLSALYNNFGFRNSD